MVIAIMGEVGLGSNSVGRLLADSLGWEFADLENLDCIAQTTGSLSHSARPPSLEALSAAIDSSNYEWKDLILSCSILTSEDQRRLLHKHPALRFVRLKEPNGSDWTLPLDEPVGLRNSGTPAAWGAATESDCSILTVDSSWGLEQILEGVLSSLILRRSLSVHAA